MSRSLCVVSLSRFASAAATIVLIAGALVWASPASAARASSAPVGQIAFVRGGHIWIMNADGGDAKQLTKSSAVDQQPVWSPKGHEITFLRGTKQLWLMNANGSHAHRVTFPIGLRQMPGTSHKQVAYSLDALAWAPSGSDLAVAANAFSSYPDMADGLNETQLFLVHPNGSSQRRIGPLIFGGPQRLSWRPTGGRMLLTQYYSMGYSYVKTFNLATRRYSATFGKSLVLSKATWSPNGRRIAAERPDNQVDVQGSARLVAYDARTHKRSDILVVDRGYGWTYLDACWSPDGNWLACAVGDYFGPTWNERPVHNIELVAATGGSSSEVMANADQPAWRPN